MLLLISEEFALGKDVPYRVIFRLKFFIFLMGYFSSLVVKRGGREAQFSYRSSSQWGSASNFSHLAYRTFY